MDQSERSRRAARARKVVRELADQNITAVVISFVDTVGVTRIKTVPLAKLERAAAWGVGYSPVFDTFLIDDSIANGRFCGGPAGDLRLHPDLSRLTVLAGQPGWAWAPGDRYDQDGVAHPRDARLLLARETERLAALGLGIKAAFEVEWCVSAGDGDEFVPACQGPAYSMIRLVEQSDYLLDVHRALAAQGLSVDQIHPEYAAGQYEVSIAADDPVGAADTAVLTRQTIRAVSARHGLRASFAPKVDAEDVGNGAHVHLSLWRNGSNLMTGGGGPFGLASRGEAFAAGILTRLPALLAIGAPSVASYLRLVPSHWAGSFACWGLENREAALRLVPGAIGDRDGAANLEIKCVDAAANPYLLLAGLIAAGRAGLVEETTLPDPVDIDPGTLEPAELEKRGIQPLPTSLAATTEAFEKDPVLGEAFGEDLVDTIATVRRAEIAMFEDTEPADIVARTRWKY